MICSLAMLVETKWLMRLGLSSVRERSLDRSLRIIWKIYILQDALINFEQKKHGFGFVNSMFEDKHDESR